jgi:hypothetical protein
VGLLDFGSIEDVGQKLPVVVQHTQETAELTVGFERLAFLKVGCSFFQRLGALGRLLITKEDDLVCSEDALCRIDEDPVLLKSVEESP